MKTISKIALAAVLMSALASLSFAGQKGKKAMAATCPACKMTLVTKKDKAHTVAVKIKGKTYYCCAGCAMNKKATPKHKK